MTVTGLVLAGGQSRRMGRDKALVPYRGVPLIRRAVDTLAAVPLVTEIVVAIGESRREESYRDALGLDFPFSIRVIPDDPEWAGQGPLAALAAGLADARMPSTMVIAVDMPNVPPTAYATLLHRHPEGAVVTRARGQAHGMEPLIGVYPTLRGAAVAREILEKGTRAALELPLALGLPEVEASELGLTDAQVASVNVPSDVPA